jgi:hypothetical protein
MLWAAMPEAPVDEDRHARPWEQDVSLATKLRQRAPVDPKPHSPPMQLGSNAHLDFGVSKSLFC